MSASTDTVVRSVGHPDAVGRPDSTGHVGLVARRRPGVPNGYGEYERVVDPDTCLHLLVADCDHRVYRCLRCCRHTD